MYTAFEKGIRRASDKLCIGGPALAGKTAFLEIIFCIDKTTTNPYRLYQKKDITEPTDEDLKELREEGTLKPVFDGLYDGSQDLTLNFTANAVFMVTVK